MKTLIIILTLITCTLTLHSTPTDGKLLSDSFLSDTALWKARYRATLEFHKDDTKEDTEVCWVNLDKHSSNGCGIELKNKLKLKIGGTYRWSFHIKNPDDFRIAVSVDGTTDWQIIKTDKNYWRRVQINFKVDGEKYKPDAVLAICVANPKNLPGKFLIDNVTLSELKDSMESSENQISFDQNIMKQGSELSVNINISNGQTSTSTVTLTLWKGYPGCCVQIKGMTQKISPVPSSTRVIINTEKLTTGCYFVKLNWWHDSQNLSTSAPFAIVENKFFEKFMPSIGLMVTDPAVSSHVAEHGNFHDYNGGSLKKIIQQYRKYGINMFAITKIWSWWEPAREDYRFDLIRKIREIAHHENVKYQIKVQQWSIPKDFWIKNRVKFQSGATGKSLSLWDANINESYCKIWGKIATEFKDDPYLFSYAPTFGLEENSIGNDYGGPRGGMADYSEVAQNAWQSFLKKKYTLNDISDAYKNNFTDWSQIKIPLPDIHGANPVYHSLWTNFLRFRLNRLKELYTSVFKTIRTYDKNTPITFKLGKLFPYEMENGSAGYNGYDIEDIFELAEKYNIRPAHTVIEDPVMASIMWGMADLYKVNLWAEGGTYFGPAYYPEEEKRIPATMGFTNTMAYGIPGIEIPYYPLIKPQKNWVELIPWYNAVQGYTLKTESIYLGYFPDDMWGVLKDRGFGENISIIFSELSERLRWMQRNGYQYRVVTRKKLHSIPPKSVVFDGGTFWLDKKSEQAIYDFVLNGGTYIANLHTGSNNGQYDLLRNKFNLNIKYHKKKQAIKLTNGNELEFNSYLTCSSNVDEKIMVSPEGNISFSKKYGNGKLIVIGLPRRETEKFMPQIYHQVGIKRLPYHTSNKLYVRTLIRNKDCVLIVSNPSDERVSGIIHTSSIDPLDCYDLVRGVTCKLKNNQNGSFFECNVDGGRFRIFKLKCK